MFHIHSDVINKFLFKQVLYHFWIAPIRIKFHEKTEIFDTFTKIWKVCMNSWFSSTNHHSIEESLPRLEKPKKNLLVYEIMADLFNLLRDDKLRIMTKFTSEITPRCENYRRKFPRIIKKGRFFDCGKQHRK